MDSAIDTLSTTSEHSVASSIESTTAAMNSSQNSSKRSHSPYNNNTSHNNHNSYHSNGRMRPSSCSPQSSPNRHQGSPRTIDQQQSQSTHSAMIQQMQHQLSPPPQGAGTPNGLPAGLPPRMPHLPPHSLGLLNSLQMMHHASPLELMAAAHHQMPPRSYNSPPPISTSDPSANECKLVEYRGQKVAAFIISGETMLCLPQAFELFLKHLVGGLHTVYTKLKRLDIVPLVCNVEQVRILRGLGAIQPGVNRCKLLCCKDFDVLYRDCTTASNSLQCYSSRPGRPPKRGPVGLSLPPTHLSQHPQMKKHRLDNGEYAYENGHINDMSRMDKSPLLANGYNPPPINHMAFMQMNHHPGSALISPGMPPHGLHNRPDSAAMMKAAAQSGMSAASMEAIARSGIWENCRAAYEDIVKHLERLRDGGTDDRQPSVEAKVREISSRNGSPSRQSPVLNLSKSGGGSERGSNCDDRSDRSDIPSPAPTIRDEDDNLSDDNVSDNDDRIKKEDDLSDIERSDSPSRTTALPERPTHHYPSSHHQTPPHHLQQDHQRALNYSTLAANAAVVAAATSAGGSGSFAGSIGNNSSGTSPVMGVGVGGVTPNEIGQDPQSASSTETLLRNIQSLLKVAADNARQQERQITYEKAELKMDVIREREVKDSLERQLVDERKLRILYQKRYRRERKARIRLQQQMDGKRKSNSHILDRERDLIKGSVENCKNNNNNQEIDCSKPSDKTSEKSQSSERHRGSESPTFQRESSERAVERDRESTVDRESASSTLTQNPDGSTTPGNNNAKGWNYPGIDLMATGAFWQNYSETLAQEIEMERKVRQQTGDRDVKSPLQDRSAYYKNSVLFGSAT
ncbi:DACH1 family protein [Megaselia abdita]